MKNSLILWLHQLSSLSNSEIIVTMLEIFLQPRIYRITNYTHRQQLLAQASGLKNFPGKKKSSASPIQNTTLDFIFSDITQNFLISNPTTHKLTMSGKPTSNASPPDDFDDSINLESKVLLALSRLQNRKNLWKKPREAKAVSCSNVVRFLKANYSWLDGDIQSQVKTALLSFVKTGVVCILDNAKYRLLVPNSKIMSFPCSTRITHGPQCSCLFTLKCMLKNSPNICCLLKNYGNPRKKINSVAKRKIKRKKPYKESPNSSSGGNRQTKCLLQVKDSSMSTRKRTPLKCSNCAENHPPVPKKTCRTCNDTKGIDDVPDDIFSPRDEVLKTS